jgi:hypothetical protein
MAVLQLAKDLVREDGTSEYTRLSKAFGPRDQNSLQYSTFRLKFHCLSDIPCIPSPIMHLRVTCESRAAVCPSLLHMKSVTDR